MADRKMRDARARIVNATALASVLLWGACIAPAHGQTEAEELALEEIIVTARKREESLAEVPVSVAAYSGLQLERNGIENVVDLYGNVPGLYFSNSVVSPNKDYIFLVIRGVGANSGGEPSAGTFVDGVYSPSLGFDIGFLDLERVEILRGPQGTLFGRNTQAGALNIVTRRPGPDVRRKAAIEIDEFESFRFQGALSGPVIEDKLFLGLSVEAFTTDGFATNTAISADVEDALGQNKSFDQDANDHRSYAARISALYNASDSTDVYFTFDWSNKKGNDVAPGFRRGCNCYEIENEFQIEQEFGNFGGALTVDIDLGSVALSSITGFRFLDSKAPFDFDGGTDFTGNVYDVRTEQSIVSEELRLSSQGADKLSWVGGVYLFRERLEQDRDFFFPDLDTPFAGINVDAQIVENVRKGLAVFGQANYAVTDRLELSVGARYAYEHVDNTADVDFTIPAFGLNVRFFDTPSESFDAVTPMASISYDITDDVMTYFTYSEGFKAGGFQKNTASLASNIPFDSERSRNFEVGLKMRALSGRLQLDASVFRVNLTDQQLQTIVQVGEGDVPISAIANAGESHTQGFELSANVLVTPALRLDASLGYVEAEFDQFIDEDGTDRAGDPFPFVPDWTAQVGGEYRFPLSDGDMDLVLGANYRYVGDYETGTGTSVDPIFQIDSYDRLDARLGLEAERWRLTVFAENLLDSYDVTHVWNAFFFAGNRVNFDQVLAPRRVGLRATYSF